MFGKLKAKLGKADSSITLLAPIAGESVPISKVEDATFNQEILGKGLAIIPSAGRVVSPADGVIETIFDTGHAVSIHTKEGVDVLIHVGLDTVQLQGKHYTKHVATGATVSKGDLLIEFDLDGIRADGYDIITPVVICNSGDFSDFQFVTDKTVSELDNLIRLTK